MRRESFARWGLWLALGWAAAGCDDTIEAVEQDIGGVLDRDEGMDAVRVDASGDECVDGDERACAAEDDPCGAGVQRCVMGLWLDCVGNATPAEVCNDVDDDCDGRVDEPVGRSCKAEDDAAGRWACDPETAEVVCVACFEDRDGDGSTFCDDCDDGEPASRPGAAEVCDGIDNDCDRMPDEGFDVGQACRVGEGVCARDGRRMCTEDGGAACDVEPGAGEVEACNAVDDDCDGLVDEGFPVGEPCRAGVGLCIADGRFACDPVEGVVCDAAPGEPEEEVCDAVDNDCDGSIDEVAVDEFGDIENCGACGNVCPGPGPVCIQAACYRTYWVDAADGSDADGDGTEGSPWRTITHAVATAEGDRARIMIRPGTYSPDMHPEEFERFPVDLWDGVQLIGTGEGVDAAAAVQLRADRVGYFIWADAREQPNRAEAMTFTGFGGAFLVDDSRVTLENIRVVDAETIAAANRFAGAALAVGKRGAEIEIADARVERVDMGGRCGVRLEGSTAVIRRAAFVDNLSGNPDGQVDGQICNIGGDLTVINSSFVENTAHGVLINGPESTNVIVHSTFSENTGHGVYAIRGAGLTIANSIFAFHGRSGVFTDARVPGEVQRLASNLFWQNAAGHYAFEAAEVVAETADAVDALPHAAGSVEGDPVFFSLEGNNVRIRAASAADGRASDAFREPVDQARRLRGDPADIGAFETEN